MQAFSLKTSFLSSGQYNDGMQPGPKPVREQPFFGKRLAYFRQQRGLTQQELAQELGMTRELIGHYERRCENPSIEFLLNFSKTMGISLDELLGLKSEREKPGPSPKALKVAERISQMSRGKQAVVIGMLEGAIAQAG